MTLVNGNASVVPAPGVDHMKTKTCPDCNGDGVINKDTDDERQCPTCGGLGFVRDDDDGDEEVIKTDTQGNFSRH